jgi:hypothetical protein
MMKRILGLLAILILLGVAAYLVYQLPPVHARLAWRVEGVRTKIVYALHPPEKAVFVPQQVSAAGAGLPPPAVRTTRTALPPTISPEPTASQPAATSASPLPATAMPTLATSPTPLPGRITLTGVVHEYQQMNNCGPTTLAMALSYWGWQGDQTDTRAVLRPAYLTVDDKNVNPAEMVDYVEAQTGLAALVRSGGDLEVLKRLIAAGFPVVVEKGFQPPDEYWMGHYELLTGYDEAAGVFTAQDSYIMPDLPVYYPEIQDHWWRDFNRVFLVVYPPEQQVQVMAALGPYADPQYGYQHGEELARAETTTLSGRDLYFAWFDLGTNLVALGDFKGAAEAYDRAFVIYPNLPEHDRPWRVLWYQSGPYEAYYGVERYADLLALANQTLATVGRPILEESYYWMGKARQAQGEMDKAVQDYRTALELNPNYAQAQQELAGLGLAP